MVKTAKDYLKTSLYEEPQSRAWTTIEVLSFLVGLKWNDLALQYCHALRPSAIRVSTGEIHCTSRNWRITVFVDGNNTITKIEQEVVIGGKYGSGYTTNLKLLEDIKFTQWRSENDNRSSTY